MAIDLQTYYVQRRAAGASDSQIQNEWQVYSAGIQQQQQQAQAMQITQSMNERTAALERQIAESTAANQATVEKITSGFQGQLAATNQGYQSLLDQLGGMQIGYQNKMQETISGIQGMIGQQQQQYQDQLAKSANLARASVPTPAPSAMAPTIGRQRKGVVGENASNMLANLQIFGRSAKSNPLAGLQIT